MKLPFLFSLLICSVAALPALAEYRVFRLVITSANGDVKSFLSTLDPDQYRGYFPIRPDEKISYTETWRCYGRTGDNLPPCDNPRAPASAVVSGLPSDKGPEPVAPPSN